MTETGKDILVTIEELKQAMDLVDISICITNTEGVEVWGNKAWEHFYNLKRNEILGRNVFDLEREGVYNPSLARQILETGKEKSIIHRNEEGRELLSRGRILTGDDGEMIGVIAHALDITDLVNVEKKLQKTQEQLDVLSKREKIRSNNIIAEDPVMEDIINLIDSIADIDDTIMLTGESGTGKSKIADYIHDVSDRHDRPFVSLNCGAIPDALFESELFGYESGAFTGSSDKGKIGLFEAANGGTLFLDEISEMPLNLQVKLLQVLQDRTIKRVGGVEAIDVDVRIIVASNRDLETCIADGKFRDDLYYRLNVIPIEIPPLRERREDILIMISEFLKSANRKYKKHKRLSTDTMAILLKYNWPGNVRELENIIKRLVITSKTEEIGPELLPKYVYAESEIIPSTVASDDINLKEAVDMFERQLIVEARNKWKGTRKMADHLGVDQSTIVRKMKKYKI